MLPLGSVILPLSWPFATSQWWSIFRTTFTVYLCWTLNNMKWYYVLNIGLSLLLSVEISELNNLPYKLVGEVVVVQLIQPLIASDGIFGPLQILWMRTFASEFVQEPLKGVRPNDPEVIPHTFDVMTTRGVSLVIHMYLLLKTECRVDPPPHLPGGHPEGKQAQAAYWSSLWDPIAWANR